MRSLIHDFLWVMTDEFTKTSFYVFMRKKMHFFAGERKKTPRN